MMAFVLDPMAWHGIMMAWKRDDVLQRYACAIMSHSSSPKMRLSKVPCLSKWDRVQPLKRLILGKVLYCTTVVTWPWRSPYFVIVSSRTRYRLLSPSSPVLH